MSQPRLILASASPRRRELLDQLGVRFTCSPAHIDESHRVDENPSDYVQRMAQEKAQAIALLSTGSGLGGAGGRYHCGHRWDSAGQA